MKMTKKIYSQQVVMQKSPLKANRFIAIVMGLALLPLGTIAAATNPVSSTANANANADASVQNAVPANSDDNHVANSSNDALATKPSNTNSVTAPLDNINELQRTNEAKPGTAVESPLATPTKKAPWYNLSYLLGGGLLLLILGGALLLFLKIGKLQDDIAGLARDRQSLRTNLNKSAMDIEQLKQANLNLKSQLSQQAAARHESQNEVTTDGIYTLEDAQVPAPVIEDLNAADRQQLAVSIDKWFATNRGQTKLTDLLPVEIQNKLKQFQWCIELWGQGYGIDSVELVESTKDAAVVSLIKPNKQGFAYCYKKPSSLSSVWENRAWYEVQRTSSTLEVIGEPLEIN